MKMFVHAHLHASSCMQENYYGENVCVVRVVAIVLLAHSRGSSCLKGRGLFVLMLVPMFQ